MSDATNLRVAIKYLVRISHSVAGVLSSTFEYYGLIIMISATASSLLIIIWYWVYHQY